MKTQSLLFVSILVSFCVSVCIADEWLNPTNLRVSSYSDSNFRPLYAINGAGLASGLDNHSMSGPQTMWKTAFAPGNWAGWFEVDFGEVCNLSKMVLYNFNEKSTDIDATDVGVGPFQVLVSDNGVDYYPIDGVWVAAKSPGKDREPPIIPDTGCPPQEFPLGIAARFAKLRILDNYGYRHTVNGVVGLSELRFYGSSTGVAGNIPPSEFTISAPDTYRGDVQYLVDGTGLMAGTYGGHQWHNGTADGETGWSGYKDGEGKVTLTFNFNNPTNLASVQIWNLAMWFGGGDAMKDFRVLVKQVGQSEYTQAASGSIEAGSVTDYDYSKIFVINTADVVSAQLVIDSTWYEGSNIASLSEIHFIEMQEEAEPFVNLDEFEVIARYWQMTDCDFTQPCIEADWYYDGVIDMFDMQLLAADWLK